MKRFIGIVTMLSLAMFLLPSVSMAGRWMPQGGSDYDREVRVSNYNSASILNVVDSSANTGHNYADGSYAGDGDRGGDIDVEQKYPRYRGKSHKSDARVEHAGTGNGGNGGWSANGGYVNTGAAVTDTDVMNMANSNTTRVEDSCGCPDDDRKSDVDVDVRVSNKNRAHVFNAVASHANTGHNDADGSYAGDGDRGGDIDVEGRGAKVEYAGTGNGGDGGESGMGGTIYTGDAHTETSVVTIVNRNVTRVR